jgi:hypothetical protein
LASLKSTKQCGPTPEMVRVFRGMLEAEEWLQWRLHESRASGCTI